MSPAWLKKHQFRPFFLVWNWEGSAKKKSPGSRYFFSRLRAQNFPTVLFFLRRKKMLNKISGAKNVNSIFFSLAYSAYFRPERKIQTFAITRFFCKKNRKKPKKIK